MFIGCNQWDSCLPSNKHFFGLHPLTSLGLKDKKSNCEVPFLTFNKTGTNGASNQTIKKEANEKLPERKQKDEKKSMVWDEAAY